MALPPQTNDAFLREVDDELRRDRVEGFLRRWGIAVAIGVVVALLALAAGLWWRHHREAQANASAEALSGLLQDIEHNDTRGADQVLGRLAGDRQPGYRGAAALLRGDLALQKGDDAGAAAAYGKVAADTSLPQPFRDAATVRVVATRFDTMAPGEVISRLAPLSQPGNPFYGSAGEMTAMAYLKQGKAAQAGAAFAALVRDPGVPDTIKGRALQMASGLGVDAGVAGEVR